MRILFIAFGLILFLTSTSQIYAHAGVQKRGDNTIVTLYQLPISPLVGEEVKLTLAVTDLNLDPKRNTKGVLTLIDTYYGDESKDKKILDQRFTTDANGAFEFKYTFNKENYFNVSLQFDGQTERWQHIDFLIQPRKTGTIVRQFKNLEVQQVVFVFSGGLLVGISVIKVLEHFRLRRIRN